VRENLSASTVADLLMEARLQNELSRLREGQTVVS
jgi:hypothetical protein